MVESKNRSHKTPIESSWHAQSVFNNLRFAVKAGAIGACYENGYYQIYPNHVVDKDQFEQDVKSYTQHLSEKGVDGKSVRNNEREITNRFNEGTAAQQYEISTALSDAVEGLSQSKTRIK